jgi:biopolymer transport protein TolR
MIRTKAKREKPISEINVVPYIDVMLVLLVIFMITAPMMDNGFEVSLPNTSKQTIANDKKHSLIMTINSSGEIFLEDKKTTLKDMGVLLKNYNKKDTKIFIKGDKTTSYQNIVNAMNQLNINGFKNISLITKVG